MSGIHNGLRTCICCGLFSLSGCCVFITPYEIRRFSTDWNSQRALSFQVTAKNHLPPTEFQTRQFQWPYNVGTVTRTQQPVVASQTLSSTPGLPATPAPAGVPVPRPQSPDLPPMLPTGPFPSETMSPPEPWRVDGTFTPQNVPNPHQTPHPNAFPPRNEVMPRSEPELPPMIGPAPTLETPIPPRSPTNSFAPPDSTTGTTNRSRAPDLLDLSRPPGWETDTDLPENSKGVPAPSGNMLPRSRGPLPRREEGPTASLDRSIRQASGSDAPPQERAKGLTWSFFVPRLKPPSPPRTPEQRP